MLKYKYVEAANGRTMYYRNGKMVKQSEIPLSIQNMLEPGVELKLPSPGEDDNAEPDQTVDQDSVNSPILGKSEDRTTCIFCGEPATRIRFVNLQNAKLCDNDYSNHTTGEIAAQMREVDNQE